MRLWHIDIIQYLPDLQLLAQWRELNSIFKKQNKHILINYVYKYNKDYLYNYTQVVIDEFKKRNLKIRTLKNFNEYFLDSEKPVTINCYNKALRFEEHNDEYFQICYYNLKEKYLRHQKGYSKKSWLSLENYYYSLINKEV